MSEILIREAEEQIARARKKDNENEFQFYSRFICDNILGVEDAKRGELIDFYSQALECLSAKLKKDIKLKDLVRTVVIAYQSVKRDISQLIVTSHYLHGENSAFLDSVMNVIKPFDEKYLSDILNPNSSESDVSLFFKIFVEGYTNISGSFQEFKKNFDDNVPTLNYEESKIRFSPMRIESYRFALWDFIKDFYGKCEKRREDDIRKNTASVRENSSNQMQFAEIKPAVGGELERYIKGIIISSTAEINQKRLKSSITSILSENFLQRENYILLNAVETVSSNVYEIVTYALGNKKEIAEGLEEILSENLGEYTKTKKKNYANGLALITDFGEILENAVSEVILRIRNHNLPPLKKKQKVREEKTAVLIKNEPAPLPAKDEWYLPIFSEGGHNKTKVMQMIDSKLEEKGIGTVSRMKKRREIESAYDAWRVIN